MTLALLAVATYLVGLVTGLALYWLFSKEKLVYVMGDEHDAWLDAQLGLVELPPIRVDADRAETLAYEAGQQGIVLQEYIRRRLAWEL